MVVALEVPFFVVGVDILIHELALSHSHQHLQVSFAQLDLFIVQVVSDLLPPIFVCLSLDELFQLIFFYELGNLLAIY